MATHDGTQRHTADCVMHAIKHGAPISAGHTVGHPRQGEADRVQVKATVRIAALLGATLAASALMSASAQTPPDASGPQTAVPAPLPSGQADVPGGSARNGVIMPPAMAGTMPVVKPPAHGRTPIIRPPGTAQRRPTVQPK